ncbi:sugar-phosphate nucleotidyltransferase [Campylobacter sp. MG1]|uniref:sugar-phosphate nucleotidyltransferase n=1 Tax=Campylobacter sp. MG1 TaxID=2976332 RepID=UPI00226C6A78|nr:sugar-phosphate nucleotidyltransferase [Campylobacter sp. MG1]
MTKPLFSKNKNDECYTPAYAVFPILEYLDKNEVIWCPFDTLNSNFVKVLKDKGFNVIHSHIQDNKNFFEYEPKCFDVIVSNPPFSNKKAIFKRALSFNKPFALLMSNLWLNDVAPYQLFKDKGLELLMFDKRIDFLNPNYELMSNNRVPFGCSYFCYKFLPKQIIMKELNKNNNNLIYDNNNLFKDFI